MKKSVRNILVNVKINLTRSSKPTQAQGLCGLTRCYVDARTEALFGERMRKNIVLVLLLFSYMFIYANDSIVTKGSESISINYDENNISIQNEELNIYLFDDSYKVIIEYEYNNKGTDKQLLLGFPIKYVYTSSEKEKIEYINKYTFTQLFNNQKIEVKEEYEDESKEQYHVEGIHWIIREVDFKKGKNISKIEYTGPYSRDGFETQFNYIIESAACWNNKIKHLTITIHNDNNVLIDSNKWEIGSYSSCNFPEQFKTLKNSFSFIFENIDPIRFKEINLRIKPYNLSSNWIPFNDNVNGWGYNIYKVFQDENEIWLYTEEQIQLFINCFYASKGYIFKNKELEQYFKNKYFDLLNKYYIPDKNFNESKFNEVEKENIDFLLNMKKKLYK